jgi:hypothetical protein
VLPFDLNYNDQADGVDKSKPNIEILSIVEHVIGFYSCESVTRSLTNVKL